MKFTISNNCIYGHLLKLLDDKDSLQFVLQNLFLSFSLIVFMASGSKVMLSSLLFFITFLPVGLANNGDTNHVIQVTEVFHVKSGTENGGCDGFDVNMWFSDARFLLDLTDKALLEAKKSYDDDFKDSQVLKYLDAFFRIDSKDDSSKATVEEMRAKVQAAIEDTEPGDDTPWIFCDSTFAQEKKWTDIALAPGTGVEHPDGKSIKEVYPEIYQEYYADREKAKRKEKSKTKKMKLPSSFFPFWVDDIKQYRYAEKSNYCSKANLKNLAGVDDNAQPNTITFCTKNWKKMKYKGINALPDVIAEGVSMKDFTVESLTFLHEAFHFALENENTPDVAYNIGEVTGSVALEDGNFITREQAVANPESWTLFALAWHLGKKYPKFTFAGTEAKPL
ncbi:hypothetical protein F53441_8177 [Fusarium austroafricanum]|uniref:Uncharacterized protein n=1 Tax=Fusarium austroafricanum TaxID=2364996 RepID=A0A8H4KEM9_9HYPO|nr:hypothetical protein F53441_8177 [Fusarium austroafricanum]